MRVPPTVDAFFNYFMHDFSSKELKYQNWLVQYLICRRDNDHAMAAELAQSICAFWQARGDKTEHSKWQKVYQEHRQKTT